MPTIVPLDQVVPTVGVPLTITTNYPNLHDQMVDSIYFQALPGNTSPVYIGTRRLNVGTLTGIIARVAVPTANSLPEITWDIPTQPNPFCLADYYVDATHQGDGVLVSYMTY
jgi:hypothetical protein